MPNMRAKWRRRVDWYLPRELVEAAAAAARAEGLSLTEYAAQALRAKLGRTGVRVPAGEVSVGSHAPDAQNGPTAP